MRAAPRISTMGMSWPWTKARPGCTCVRALHSVDHSKGRPPLYTTGTLTDHLPHAWVDGGVRAEKARVLQCEVVIEADVARHLAFRMEELNHGHACLPTNGSTPLCQFVHCTSPALLTVTWALSHEIAHRARRTTPFTSAHVAGTVDTVRYQRAVPLAAASPLPCQTPRGPALAAR